MKIQGSQKRYLHPCTHKTFLTITKKKVGEAKVSVRETRANKLWDTQ